MCSILKKGQDIFEGRKSRSTTFEGGNNEIVLGFSIIALLNKRS